MLSEKDIEFMQQTRKEVIHNRRRVITFVLESDPKRNPLTGAYEKTSQREVEVLSVVTDRTSRVAAERRIREQAEIEEGDIWFSVSISQLEKAGIKDNKDIKYVIHNGEKYRVVSDDPKGIGEYNRYEFVGKRVN